MIGEAKGDKSQKDQGNHDEGRECTHERGEVSEHQAEQREEAEAMRAARGTKVLEAAVKKAKHPWSSSSIFRRRGFSSKLQHAAMIMRDAEPRRCEPAAHELCSQSPEVMRR